MATGRRQAQALPDVPSRHNGPTGTLRASVGSTDAPSEHARGSARFCTSVTLDWWTGAPIRFNYVYYRCSIRVSSVAKSIYFLLFVV